MTHLRRRRAEGRRAVTLIEVLIALAILAAMLAVALPVAMRSIEQNAFRAAQASVVGSLDEARSHAQREGVIVEVLVDREGLRLRAQERSHEGGDPTPIHSIEIDLEAPVTVASDPGDGLVALFLPDGSAPISRLCAIRGLDGLEAVISIGAHLGRATVVERRVALEGEERERGDDEEATP